MKDQNKYDRAIVTDMSDMLEFALGDVPTKYNCAAKPPENSNMIAAPASSSEIITLTQAIRS